MPPYCITGQIRAAVPRVFLAAVSVDLLAVAGSAAAQEPPDPMDEAQVQLGPLAFTPLISLTGVGIDTNVFNTADDEKADFTATVRPEAKAWLRMGRGRVIADTRPVRVLQGVSSQGGWNTANAFRFEMPYIGSGRMWRTRS